MRTCSQAALDSGVNHTAATGDYVSWDKIQPGPNGTFAVTCRQYVGSVPGGTSGGGNQLRQPYLRRLFGAQAWKQCPRADHVHFYGFYLGNYPTLPQDKILRLCDLLNDLARSNRLLQYSANASSG